MRFSRSFIIKLTLGVVLLIAVIAAINKWKGNGSTTAGQAAGDVWTCSMHPQVRMPRPGNCPICGMKLIPLSQLRTEQSRTQQQAQLEVEPVKRRPVFKEIRTVGKLDYNERRVAHIAARVAGRVDKVFADFTGIEVKKNDHLVEIYSPELYSAQAELMIALKGTASASPQVQQSQTELLNSARTKLELLGLLPEQIREIEQQRTPTKHITVYAPIAGTIVEKNIREGQYVQTGDSLYRIAELDPLWLYLDIYEYDMGWIRFGQQVDVTVEAFPGEVFRGTVVFVDPFLNDETRSVKVRVNIPNPERKLKPAMYASATIHVPLRPDGSPEPTGFEGKYVCPMHPEIVRDAAGKCPICDMALQQILGPPAEPADLSSTTKAGALAIPVSAVLDTGRRHIAYRQRKDGAYELVELKLGPRVEAKDDQDRVASYYLVLGGLDEGEKVVTRGGFLLDSQQQIDGMPSLLYPQGQSASSLHSGHGAPPSANSPSPAKPSPATEHQH